MKVPLSFQNTKYDCGTISFINALAYLYDREDIPIQLLKSVYKYTLDAEGPNHIPGEYGTSREAAKKLAESFITFANTNNFGIYCKELKGSEVDKNKMMECLNNNGVIVARCYQSSEHYVLITKMDDVFTYIFDPYYLDEEYYYNDEDVAVVLNQMFTHNRLVKTSRLFSEDKKDFSLMEKDKREMILINRR